jgi:hypothetical protein
VYVGRVRHLIGNEQQFLGPGRLVRIRLRTGGFFPMRQSGVEQLPGLGLQRSGKVEWGSLQIAGSRGERLDRHFEPRTRACRTVRVSTTAVWLGGYAGGGNGTPARRNDSRIDFAVVWKSVNSWRWITATMEPSATEWGEQCENCQSDHSDSPIVHSQTSPRRSELERIVLPMSSLRRLVLARLEKVTNGSGRV